MIWLMLVSALAADCTVISGTVAWTPDRVQKGTSIVLDEGRIAAIGTGLPGLELNLSADHVVTSAQWQGRPCDFVQGAGTIATAGLIEVGGQIGLVEVGMESASRDSDAGGDDVRASVQIVDGYNPRSTLIPIARSGGITSAVTQPGGALVGGQAGHVRLAGRHQADAVVDPSVAMIVGLGAPSTGGGIARLTELLDDARDYRRNRSGYLRGQSRPYTPGASAADLEALQPVLDRDLPLMISADRASDLEALVRFADAQEVALVVRGAAEGWLVADLLAAHEVSVVLDPMVYGSGSFDQVFGRADNPALLAGAGVQVAFATGSSHNARTLRQLAGNAVRGGMSKLDALRAITVVPAEIFGLDAGRLEAGSAAELVLWSGDPLELTSTPVAIFVDGRSVSLESRQTRLRETYRELPGTPAPPLTP